MSTEVDDFDYYGCDDDCDDHHCWRCGGDGYGIIGVNWDPDDPINGPTSGYETCNCCGGSGLAKDCRYW